MRKSLKSQLMVAITMSLIATVALTSATYAWFTSIANPQVSSINLYVKAADNLMLSAYTTADEPAIDLDADWKASISQTDIKAAVPTGNWGKQSNAFPSNLANVSSIFFGTNSSFFKQSQDTLGAPTGYISATQATDYSKFSLWVKSTKTGDLYLDTGSFVKASDTDSNYLLNTNVPDYNIQDTVRVGFVPVIAGVEDFDHAVIWEPNAKEHLATDYKGPGGTAKIDTDEAVLGTDLTDIALQTTAESTSNINLFNIAAPETAYNFNVYIWVEGSDPDTQNAVAKNYFNTFLKFVQP